ncbi:hypothetical protein LJ737_04205 [Hymenobacter sp. 15J16-1T3B]|uniref:hypothetical protein n=1 Tax=Hymenobacter sp. 15J16-1T3B TaxID=2886941 RepID=UPI001D110AC2|nr:hypothetical protein [Hymenobacter sp. 15J16-1T3B]MCC3156425.1 hypothetical protein [Hymenobacter sp. 15J16-1T3B]
MQNAPRYRFTLISPNQAALTLDTDPEGWEDLGLTLHRDPVLHGLSSEYTDAFGWLKEARRYLEREYQLGGIEADVTALIEYFDPNSFLWEEYYRARFDFGSRQLTATEFRCGLEKLGFTQSFLNRAETPVDLFKNESVNGRALAPLTPRTLQLHSRAVVKRYDIRQPDPAQPGGQNVVNDSESRRQTLYFGFGSGPEVNDFDLQPVFGGPVTVPAGNLSPLVPIYTTQESGVFDFDTQIRAELVVERNGNGNGDFDKVDVDVCFRINDEAPVVLRTIRATNIGGTYRVDLDTARFQLTRPLAIADRIFLYADVWVHDINPNALGNYSFPIKLNEQPGSYFTMQAASQTEPTPCQGLLIYEALDRVAQAITDRGTAFRSAFFGRTDTYPAYPADGPGSLLFTASGFQVRGFPLAVKPLVTTWRDLFGSLQAVHAVGCGVERLPDGQEVVRVEPLAYWYSDEVVLDLLEPVQLSTKTLLDRHFIKAEVGYQKWQTGQVNGLDEFNAKRTYATPLTQTEQTYSQLSSYVASGFHLELTRRQRYDATSTTDTGADADNYLVCVLRTADGFETERNQRFAEVTGLFSPSTAYNLRLSPGRILRAHGPVLAAGLQPQRRRALRFAAGEGNNALRTRLAAEPAAVAENGDVPVPELGAPLWRPEQYSFTAPVRHEQVAALLRNPRGRVRFRDQYGQRHEGWISDFKHRAAGDDGPLGSFDLLPCAALLPLLPR